MTIRPPIILAVIFVSLMFLAPACGEPIAPSISPNWTLHKADGVTVELRRAAAEKPQIVLFWATWCPYCKALMPHLQSIQLEYGDDINVLAITVDNDGDPPAYLKKYGFDFTLLPDDDGTVAALYDITGTPGLLLIDGSGAIRFDLRNAPPLDIDRKEMANSEIASRLAPHWAAELRKAIDGL